MTVMVAHAVKPGSEGADVEGDGAAGRCLAHRRIGEHLAEGHETVHLDLEPGVLKQLRGVLHRQAGWVGHRDKLRAAGYLDDHGLARLEYGPWGRLLADDGARGILAVGVSILLAILLCLV